MNEAEVKPTENLAAIIVVVDDPKLSFSARSRLLLEHWPTIRAALLAIQGRDEREIETVGEFSALLDKAYAENERLEEAVLEEVDNRDRAMEAADTLAYAIAPMKVIGEHSSGNDPWENAVEVTLQQRAALERQAKLEAALREFFEDDPVNGYGGFQLRGNLDFYGGDYERWPGVREALLAESTKGPAGSRGEG